MCFLFGTICASAAQRCPSSIVTRPAPILPLALISVSQSSESLELREQDCGAREVCVQSIEEGVVDSDVPVDDLERGEGGPSELSIGLLVEPCFPVVNWIGLPRSKTRSDVLTRKTWFNLGGGKIIYICSIRSLVSFAITRRLKLLDMSGANCN
jgi:hypothetical protein